MKGEELTRSLLIEEQYEGKSIDSDDGDAGDPVTGVVILSILVSACGCFGYGCVSGFSSPAEAGIMQDLGLSTAEFSVFSSIMTIGGMLGAIVCGKVADLISRRGTMWLQDTVCIAGWMAIYFAKVPWLLDMGRLLMGFGVALSCYVVPVYLAEITPKNIRGGSTAFTQLMVCCGIAIMFFIGNLIAWRTLALIGVMPYIIQAVGLFFVPESPRWLAMVGQEKALESTLQRIRGKNVDVSQEAANIRDHIEILQHVSQSSFRDLFDQRYARSLIIGVGLMLLVQFAGTSGISFYASSIFTSGGASAGVGTTLVAIILIIFSASSVLLMDTFGRKLLLMVGSAGACVGCCLTALAFLFRDFHQSKELTSILVMSGILIYNSCFAMGMGNTPWIIMSEIFPINIKGTAGSLVTTINWLCSWIVSYTFNFLFRWSSPGVFFIYGIVCGSVVIFAAKLVPETKRQTLEDIQKSMVNLE